MSQTNRREPRRRRSRAVPDQTAEAHREEQPSDQRATFNERDQGPAATAEDPEGAYRLAERRGFEADQERAERVSAEREAERPEVPDTGDEPTLCG